MKNIIAITLIAALSACEANNNSVVVDVPTDGTDLARRTPEAPEAPVVEPTPEPTVTPTPEPSASMTPQEAFTATGLGTSAAYIPLTSMTNGTGLGALQGIEIVDNDPTWLNVYLIYPDGAQNRYLNKASPDYTLQHAIDNIGAALVLVNFHWINGNTAGVEVCTRSMGVVANCVLVTQDVE